MIDYIRYTLPNGLRVVHSYDPSTVMLAVDVLYDTGARDEDRALTGIAHLFEHLMFGGSANVADFDAELQDAGGTSNAWTSADFTNFFDIVPAHNAETAFHLESDRMLALAFSPESLEVQRSVVIEEFKQQCLNQPYGDLMHGLRGALYSPEHPYSWPVIGIEPGHIASVTEEDTRRWFYSRYAPNNAVLAIVGNLPYDHGRRLVEKWFGEIPSRPIAPRRKVDPGFPAVTRRVEMAGRVPSPMVVLALPMDPYGTPDYRAADCITDLLSSGQSSRFFQNLILGGDGLIIDAEASIVGSEDPGFVMFTARTASDSPEAMNEVGERMLRQLDMLAQGDATSDELERTFNRFESTFLFNNLSHNSLAQSLALAEIHGENINDTVALQRQVTLGDIRRVASILVSRPRVELHYRKSEKNA